MWNLCSLAYAEAHIKQCLWQGLTLSFEALPREAKSRGVPLRKGGLHLQL